MTALPVNQLFLCLYDNIDFDTLENTYFSWLNPSEVERFHRIKHRDTQKQFFLTRILLRQQLSKTVAQSPSTLKFETSNHGRPSLLGYNVDFNVSHTKNLIAIAINTTSRVGVDVENNSRNGQYTDIVEHYFHDSECQQIGDHTDSFFKIWTLKEAYIKALGLGLQKSLKSFYFDIGNSEKITLVDTQHEDFSRFQKPYISGFSHQFSEQFQLSWIQFSHHEDASLPEAFNVDGQLNLTPIELKPTQILSQKGF